MNYRNEATTVISDAKWTVWKIIPLVLLIVVVFGVGGRWLYVASAPGRVAVQVSGTNNIITNYEWFKQTYQSVKAIDVKIGNAETSITSFKDGMGPRSEWDFEDKTEYGRLSSIVLGLQNQRADMVATYNARSKMATRSVFKGSELPFELQ
jgi:hypothetical protein